MKFARRKFDIGSIKFELKGKKNGGRYFLLNTTVRINYAKDNYIPELWLNE